MQVGQNDEVFLCGDFENLTVEFYVLYILNMHIKFRLNQMLFCMYLVSTVYNHSLQLQILCHFVVIL